MFGKLFASMFTGSMMGAGPTKFAVMSYVIGNAVPDKTVGMQVEINPRLVAAMIGTTEKDVQEAIDFLTAPDPKSRSKEDGGARLVQIGQFDYRVVNGLKYQAIRNREERRKQVREAVQKYRKNHPKKHKRTQPLPGQSEYIAKLEDGASEAELDETVNKYLPQPKKQMEEGMGLI